MSSRDGGAQSHGNGWKCLTKALGSSDVKSTQAILHVQIADGACDRGVRFALDQSWKKAFHCTKTVAKVANGPSTSSEAKSRDSNVRRTPQCVFQAHSQCTIPSFLVLTWQPLHALLPKAGAAAEVDEDDVVPEGSHEGVVEHEPRRESAVRPTVGHEKARGGRGRGGAVDDDGLEGVCGVALVAVEEDSPRVAVEVLRVVRDLDDCGVGREGGRGGGVGERGRGGGVGREGHDG